MRLAAPNGDSVALTIAGYQYPGRSAAGAAGWSFRDPCLTTWEARKLASWLRSIADDSRVPQPADLLVFTEPCVAFGYQRRPAAAVLRVHLSLEALPSSASGSDRYLVELVVPHEAVAAAADDWDAEVRAYPVRV